MTINNITNTNDISIKKTHNINKHLIKIKAHFAVMLGYFILVSYIAYQMRIIPPFSKILFNLFAGNSWLLGIIGLLAITVMCSIALKICESKCRSHGEKNNNVLANMWAMFYTTIVAMLFATLFYHYSASSIISAFAVSIATLMISSGVGYAMKGEDRNKLIEIMLEVFLFVVVTCLVNIVFQSAEINWLISFVLLGFVVAINVINESMIKEKIIRVEDNEFTTDCVKEKVIDNFRPLAVISQLSSFISIACSILELFGNAKSNDRGNVAVAAAAASFVRACAPIIDPSKFNIESCENAVTNSSYQAV